MKKTLLVLGLTLVSFGFAKAASAATLILSPASASYVAGQTYNVDILLNTAGANIDGVDIYHLNFNPSILQVQDASSSTSGVQITAGTLLSQTLANSVDNVAGKITFSQVATSGTTYNGSGTLATVTFMALANGTSPVTFDFTLGSTSDCNVAGGGVDKLTSVGNASFTVSGGSNPTPTPSPTPSPTPGPSPTPSPTPGPTPSPTPGPTPTPSPAPVPIRPDMYPPGTIYKYANNATVYILNSNEVTNPITDWSVYLNQVPTTRSIITMPAGVNFTSGAVLGLRSGTLIKSSDNPTVYLVVNGKKEAFSSQQQFFDHNYNFSNVYTIDDVNLVNAMATSTDAFVRPTGTLFKYANSPAVYYLNSAGQKRGYTTIQMFNIWNATLKDVITIPATETYPDGPVATLPNGIVVKGSASTIYFVYNNTLRPFTDMNLFTAMGLTAAQIKTFSDADLALQVTGSAMQ